MSQPTGLGRVVSVRTHVCTHDGRRAQSLCRRVHQAVLRTYNSGLRVPLARQENLHCKPKPACPAQTCHSLACSLPEPDLRYQPHLLCNLTA